MTTSTDEDEKSETRSGVERRRWEEDVRAEVVDLAEGGKGLVIFDKQFGENGWLKSDTSKRLDKMN